MKLRYAILLGLINSLALAWLLGSYNGSQPPPDRMSWALVRWPTGNVLTLFLTLAVIWGLCLMCVSWDKAPVQWYQWIITTFVLAGTLMSARYLATGIYHLARH
jgi:hypothetical protein